MRTKEDLTGNDVVAVESVIPAPDSTNMLVTIKTSVKKESVLEALERAYGKIRSEIASSIHRKKVPQLRFEVRQH